MSNPQLADKLESPALMSLPELERASGGAARAPKSGERKALGKPFQPGVRTAGRQKGQPNRLTVSLREAVELAVQPGQCHPHGFAGWLVERAQGGIEDRKIFAGVVGRVIPLQIQQKSENNVRIELGWLNGRDVGRHLSQPLPIATQVIDITAERADGPVIKDQSDVVQGADAGQAGTQE